VAIQQSDVLRALATVDKPIDVRALAKLVDAEGEIDALNKLLNGLVRHLRVKRHHNGDGILRYSLLMLAPAPAPAPPPAPAPATVTPLRPEQSKPDTRPNIERIRELLRGAQAPMEPRELHAQLPDLTLSQIMSSLSAYKTKGEFVSVPGKGRAQAWALASDTAIAVAVAHAPHAPEPADTAHEEPLAPPAPPPPAPPPAPEPEPGPAAAVRELEKAVQAAEEAQAAYLKTVVDPMTWWWLGEAVRSARAALVGFTQGASP